MPAHQVKPALIIELNEETTLERFQDGEGGDDQKEIAEHQESLGKLIPPDVHDLLQRIHRRGYINSSQSRIYRTAGNLTMPANLTF